MLFNSIEFLFFFIIVTILFFALPQKARWFHLLIASCVFYSAFIPVYLLVLFLTIIIDYYAGIWIEKASSINKKKYLIISIVSNLSILAFFKYYNFFIENINWGLSHYSEAEQLPYLQFILPIGLSFHTFQAMSYTIEVYRGNQKAEKHFGIYALYVMFFPQLVAGPIERPQHIIHQFYQSKKAEFDRIFSGIRQMIWGGFKKVVVADLLGLYVDSIYDNYHVNTGLTFIVATYAFAFQIYCDFSGYSDIAIGAAKVLGYDLMENFNLPYFSKSVTEFWRRWHISLSSWLRDYLYISLGGNRKGKIFTYRNLLITMLLGGLWHGASWNFIIWGFLNGLFLSVEKAFKINPTSKNIFLKSVAIFITFNLIAFTWIFFRSHSFEQATFIVKEIFCSSYFFNIRIQDTGIFASMLFGLGIMLLCEYFMFRKKSVSDVKSSVFSMKNIAFVTFLIFIIVLFGMNEGDQFIYFQF